MNSTPRSLIGRPQGSRSVQRLSPTWRRELSSPLTTEYGPACSHFKTITTVKGHTMAEVGLCFRLSLCPCENQIVLCVERKGEKGFAYTPIFWKILPCLKRGKKRKFSVTWFWMLLLARQTTGRNAGENLSWMNNGEFFSLDALNPIRSLLRVMHGDFTLPFCFGRLWAAGRGWSWIGPDWRLVSLMCTAGSCALVSHWNCLGSTDDLFRYSEVEVGR